MAAPAGRPGRTPAGLHFPAGPGVPDGVSGIRAPEPKFQATAASSFGRRSRTLVVGHPQPVPALLVANGGPGACPHSHSQRSVIRHPGSCCGRHATGATDRSRTASGAETGVNFAAALWAGREPLVERKTPPAVLDLSPPPRYREHPATSIQLFRPTPVLWVQRAVRFAR